MQDSDRTTELIRRLTEGFLVGDGAMGTTLSAHGHEAGGALELLNVEQPDLVRAAHRGFLEAGSDVIQTNTFQGSRPALDNHGLGDRTVELNAAAAALAREVAGDSAFLAGSIGPTSKLLEPYGDVPAAAARDAFEEQTQTLAAAGVEFFIVETMSAIEEAILAVTAAAATGLPVVASMAFVPIGRTDFGVFPEQAATQLSAAGAIVVGANCGVLSSAEMVGIIRLFREVTDLPLIAQPNAGRPRRTQSGVVFPESPELMAEAAPQFRDLGVTLIGGCCGSTADHIRAIAARLREA